MKKLRLILLAPIGAFYGIIALLRRKLYNKKNNRYTHATMPTICIGNLAVGGTGKTPHTEYLLRMLSERFTVATLSRGYGRKTKGYILAEATHSAAEVGDEPLQMKMKFPSITVAVCEKRKEGLLHIAEEKPSTQVVLLDDAFQHLEVRCRKQIILTDYASPYYQDFPLPAGNLREFKSAANEADTIIVTKCPNNLSLDEATDIEKRLKLRSGQSCFFTCLEYERPQALTPTAKAMTISQKTSIVLLSGIAHPEHLYHHLSLQYNDIESIEFPDHHNFNKIEIGLVCKKLAQSNQEKVIFITEKDAARLQNTELWEMLSKMPVFSIPVKVKFLWKGEDFQREIESTIERQA